MILLIPITPEVPPLRAPKLWPALVMIIGLGIGFIESYDTLMADTRYVDQLNTFVTTGPNGMPMLNQEGQEFLAMRPLLRIAPAKGDWDVKRLLYANFVHGSVVHLTLNLVGVFAGMRLCATFIPFLCSLSIFLLGGSFGLGVSLFVSREVSEFIPHVGASAGLFALMGTYYVYNFRFRTRYFFWYPSRDGLISLRTSLYLFLDVVLLELLLSAAQLFPQRLDSVDHIAHVVGFSSGALLALMLRAVQRWPSFLQSRGEFIYWTKLIRPKVFDPIFTPYETWLEILTLNPYNDLVKIKVCRLICRNLAVLKDGDLERAFKFFSPTFLRLHSREVSIVILAVLSQNRKLPRPWLLATPYDSVIRLARYMANPPEAQPLLLQFVTEYRRAHPEGGDIDRKLELLMSKLSGVVPVSATAVTQKIRRSTTTGTGAR